MSTLTVSGHAAVRMAQRGIESKDAELIVLIGTNVEHGYLVRRKDYQDLERDLKKLLNRIKRLVGKRLVVASGQIVTVYHASKTYQRRLLRRTHECDLYD